ncbi:MAG: sigma-70 family RNA polymerase sigma factor [Chloroflexi bacterium]|nr:sigma-70 family RNA polymerase sigma factor [Chloroflexota bacterium]
MDGRTNEEWLAALREPGPERQQALLDLRQLLVRGLGYALAKFEDVRDSDLDDFAQEAILKIVESLDTFRGESRFLTWATKIAVRVAYTELRRARWRDVPLQIPVETSEGEFIPQTYASPAPGPEEVTVRREVIAILNDAIANELTDKQRQAIVAVVVQGMPLDEVAQRMGSNRNALYKLLHDARQKLRQRLLERGLTPQEILEAFAETKSPQQTVGEMEADGKR